MLMRFECSSTRANKTKSPNRSRDRLPRRCKKGSRYRIAALSKREFLLLSSVQYLVVVPFGIMRAPSFCVLALVLVIAQAKPYGKIRYDQRQEGKWNIRADLENFVVLIIPKSPALPPSLSGTKNMYKRIFDLLQF